MRVIPSAGTGMWEGKRGGMNRTSNKWYRDGNRELCPARHALVLYYLMHCVFVCLFSLFVLIR